MSQAMEAVTKPAPHPFQPQGGILTLRRNASNLAVIGLTGLITLAAASFLIYITVYVIRQGIAYLNLAFFTQPPAAIGQEGGGVAPAIQGTIILIVLAALFGGPPGIFTGIYLAEIGRGRFADAVRFLVDMLTGIPTIIFGLFAWALIVVPAHGFSAVSGGVALGIIMIPTVARTTEDVLRLVPAELREASAALGATQSRTTLRVVLPAARSGIATGFILAIARVAGETAPLLMTAFGSPFFFTSLNRPVAALPLQVFVFTLSPYQAQINQAHAVAFILLALVVIASMAVRLVTGGFVARIRR
jgi:phosphate transport system permease protein